MRQLEIHSMKLLQEHFILSGKTLLLMTISRVQRNWKLNLIHEHKSQEKILN